MKMGLFSKKKDDNVDVNQFLQECIIEYHEVANHEGYANRGLISIPELMPIGQQTVLAFLKDSFFQMQFGNNPQTYYYVIMSLSLQAGIVFAKKWHENYNELKNG